MVSILQKVVWMRRIRNFGFRVDLDLANGGKIKISWENIHLSMLTVKQGNLIIAIDWSPHPTGRLLVTAHQDGTCRLHDIRGRRHLQTLHQHSGEVRSVRLSPPATHLLSVGYDGNLVLTDLQGDITMDRQSVTVGRHEDKVVSVR